MSGKRAFLTGEWRYLAMLNYRVDAAILAPYVPRDTVLDSWHGSTYISVVGFVFRDTRILGVPIPRHRSFEEVNLRFYVRHEDGTGVKRGVTFIKEIVPRRAIAAVARLAYNEPYVAMPMTHTVSRADAPGEIILRVEYAWKQPTGWSRLKVEPIGAATEIAAGSEQEFITEHYWGYTAQRDGGTIEYQVTHPRWRVWEVQQASLTGDLASLYGPALGAILSASPDSAFLADGSEIVVGFPSRLPSSAAR